MLCVEHMTDDVGSVIQRWITVMTEGTEEVPASYMFMLYDNPKKWHMNR